MSSDSISCIAKKVTIKYKQCTYIHKNKITRKTKEAKKNLQSISIIEIHFYLLMITDHVNQNQ